jgi:hypothetical protein
MDRPEDANGVLRDVISQWFANGEPPTEVQLRNVRGEWNAPLADFLAMMAGEGGDTMPGDARDELEAIVGEPVGGTYGVAAAELLAKLPHSRAMRFWLALADVLDDLEDRLAAGDVVARRDDLPHPDLLLRVAANRVRAEAHRQIERTAEAS